jgi:hypothetical protein
LAESRPVGADTSAPAAGEDTVGHGRDKVIGEFGVRATCVLDRSAPEAWRDQSKSALDRAVLEGPPLGDIVEREYTLKP